MQWVGTDTRRPAGGSGDHTGKASGLRWGPHQRAQPHRAHQLWQVSVCDGKNGEVAIWVHTGHLGQEFLERESM